MSVFIEKSVCNKRDIFSAGISLMNVSTGKIISQMLLQSL